MTAPRPLTQFQSQVYFLCSQIPLNHVTTYKIIAEFLISSPRAIGQALKNNPFDPSLVPCHRVIKSNLLIGGYQGKTTKEKIFLKQKRLAEEGIFFNAKGYLLTKNIFQNFQRKL